jgi:hypothetical protein
VNPSLSLARGDAQLLDVSKWPEEANNGLVAHRACAAVLTPISSAAPSETVLSFAINTRNPALTSRVLGMYKAMLEIHRQSPAEEHEVNQHVTDRIQVWELCEALRVFPTRTAALISGLQLSEQDADLVLGDRARFNFAAREKEELVLGSRARNPKGFWACSKNENNADDEQPICQAADKGGLVEALFCPIRDFAGPPQLAGNKKHDILHAVIGACRSTHDFRVMKSPLIALLVDFKWKTFARREFSKKLIAEGLFILSFTCNALLFERVDPPVVGLAFLGLSCVLLSVRIMDEAHQLYASGGLRRYLGEDDWNCLDFLNLMAVTASLIVQIHDSLAGVRHSKRVAVAHSAALPLCFLKLLFYMQGSQQMGVLVRMVIGITKRVVDFVIILVLLLVGFALSFFVLFRAGPSRLDDEADDEEPPNVFSSVPMALLSGFTLMLGDFELSDFEWTANFHFAILLFVFFM